MAHDRGLGESREERQDVGPAVEGAAGELADHEGMGPRLPRVQTLDECAVATAEVVDPDGSVDQHVPLASGAGTTAGYAPEARLGPAERREAAGALTRDERLEASVEQRRLAFEAAEALRFPEERLVDVQRRAHVHQYVASMQTRQGPRDGLR
jgi:hypothetical protein